jgi:hypothetical protein
LCVVWRENVLFIVIIKMMHIKNHSEITNLFIIPVCSLMLVRTLALKSKKISVENVALLCVIVYLMAISLKYKNMNMFYLALGSTAVIFYKLVEILIRCTRHKMVDSIVAASVASIQSVEKSKNKEQAKVTASVNGAAAAAKTAKDAGMDEKEITKAAIIGQVTGAMVAENMEKL